MGLLYCFVVILYVLHGASDILGEGSLEMVHLLYRHGARSPLSFYPNDPYKPEIWPDGPGQLTPIGMTMEYNLGRFLKERYVDAGFLGPLYLNSQVYVHSSNSDRCLQSAEAQLAGLFPPVDRQIWNKDILWQPIPVHSVDPGKDPLTRPGATDCPRLYELMNANSNNPDVSKKAQEAKVQGLLKLLTEMAGFNVALETLGSLVDTLTCEKANNMDIPEWAVENWQDMTELNNWLISHSYKGSDELGRLSGGALLGLMINNMKQQSSGKDLDALHKLNIFSGHDTTILALMTTLNVDIYQLPPFASCVIVELYKKDRSYFVEMRYRNDSSGILYDLQLNDCVLSCPLDTFVRLMRPRIPVNRELECQISLVSKIKRLTGQHGVRVAALATGIGGLLVVFICLVLICRRRAVKWRRVQYTSDARRFELSARAGDSPDLQMEDRQRLVDEDVAT